MVACLRKAGFPGVGRCEDARGAGAGIGQSPQPIPDRPAYHHLQAGRHLPTKPTFCPTACRGPHLQDPSALSRGGQDLRWRSSLELQQVRVRGGGLQSVLHTMNMRALPLCQSCPVCILSLPQTIAQQTNTVHHEWSSTTYVMGEPGQQ